MKILFVFNHPAPYKVRLLNELGKYFDLSVIFERQANKDREKDFYSEQKYNFKNIKIKGIKIKNENIFSFGIKNHLKKNKYDLVIMNGYSTFAEMIAIKYLKKKKIPYCLYINGGIINKNESSLKRKIKTYFIKDAAYYFSPDERSNQYLIYYKANKDKIFNYTYSTIYEKEIKNKLLTKEEIDILKKEKGLSDFEKIFISTGQLIKRKNYLNLIKCWSKNDKNLLIIFGKGKQEKIIKQYLKENNITNIKLMGFANRDILFSYYSLADAFIFPSKEDIYGHVINEALSQGLPIISTKNVNSSLKLIKEEYNGYFLEKIDNKSVLDAINKIDNINKENCVKTAKENTIEIMVKDHVEILKHRL